MTNIIIADTEKVNSLILPIEALRQAWNQFIVPVALAEPALLHAISTFASSNLPPLQNMPLADCLPLVHSHKMAAIRLINVKLRDVHEATQVPVIAAILFLAGQEVSFRCSKSTLVRPSVYDHSVNEN